MATIKRLFLFSLLFLTLKSNANVGGATYKPGLMGDPIIWKLTNISVIKEDLSLKFFERDNQKICSFTAIYYLQSDTNQIIPVSGIFYGLRANNLQVYYNEVPIYEAIDSSNFKDIDRLIITAAHHSDNDTFWSDWRNIVKKGFKFDFNPQNANVLKVTGEITLAPTYHWYTANSAIYTKHPFLNKNLSKGDEIFHYLISPIETWKSVGQINIDVEYPAKWKTFFQSIEPEQLNPQKDSNIIRHQFTFKEKIPKIFSITIKRPHQYLFVGGGNIGFSRVGKSRFATKYGWEFGINHGIFINTLLSFEYETNYANYHQFCISVLPSTPWFYFIPGFSAGLGVPMRIIDKKMYSGVRLRTDFSWGLFNISFNWDYIPSLNIDKERRSFYGFSF
jgi:hypothetical protein